MSEDYKKDLEKYSNQNETKLRAELPLTGDNNNKLVPKPDPILLRMRPCLHPLSKEEQQFFIKITEGAFGYNEPIRNEILQVLSTDYHVKFLAPFLSNFIREAIHVNLAYPDLSLLIYSVRMTKSLMANPHVPVKEYLHILLPAVLSCVLSKRICKYNYDNHWTLRDFSAQVIAGICQNFSNKVNNITKRVTRLYIRAIQDPRKPLTTVYGGLKGLGCLGEEFIKGYVLPFLPNLSQRMCTILERSPYTEDGNLDARYVRHVIDVILNTSGPVLFKYHNTNDGGATYIREFGYLGYSLYTQVKSLEKAENDRRNNFNVYWFLTQQRCPKT